MNNPHRGARLPVHSREQIVARCIAGQTAAEVAAAFAVSVRTVRKWLARFRAGAALSNLASAPARVSGRLVAASVALILHLRRTLRMTGAAIAAKLGLAWSTVARWLRRAGVGRLAQIDPPEPVRRSQRERPGELIHLDIKTLGRFERPGHRVTGTRVGCRNRGAGWGFVHLAVDDATRLAYVEVLADARKNTTTGFLLRALRWFRARGIRAERVMTDNGSAYRSRRFAKALRLLAIRHIFTRPCTPKTKGKAERFIQTLLREWAYGLAHPSSNARNEDRPRWLDQFNRSRPHSALNGLSPFQTVNNLMRTHSYGAVWHFVHGAGLRFKKSVLARETERPEIVRRRERWKRHQGEVDPKRLVFLDVKAGSEIVPVEGFPREGWVKTNMAPLRGWAPRGARPPGRHPHGHCRRLTFLAAFRADRIDAPCLFNGPINGESFTAWVELALVPTLQPGDVVVLDSLGSHKGRAVRAAIRKAGAHLLFLPP